MSTESQLLQAILAETRRLADAQERATKILERLTGGGLTRAAQDAAEPADKPKPKRKPK